MPRIESIRLPGRWRWNRWVSFAVDDYGGMSAVSLGRKRGDSSMRAIAKLDRQARERAGLRSV